MSTQKSVQKKTFLKKGTRQFLSNAQVRSQSSKPKIVDFGADQQQNINTPVLKVRSSQNVDTSNQDIRIKVKPSSSKAMPPSKVQQPNGKKIERPPIDRNKDVTANKPKRQTSIGRKKQAGLSDYLDNQSGLNDQQYQPRKVSASKHQPSNMSNNKKIQNKRGSQVKKIPQVSNLKYANLIQQQDDLDEQQTPNFFQNDSFKPINNPFKNKNTTNQNANNGYNNPINNNTRSISPKVEKKIPEQKKIQVSQKHKQQYEQNEQVHFISDQSDEEEDTKKYNNRPYGNAKNVENTRKQQKQQNQQIYVSKVKNKFFNKNQNQNNNTQNIGNNQRNKTNSALQQQKPKKLSINDIPKQLRQQIIKQTIAQKQQQLTQELQKLKQKFTVINKQKQKLQEEQKLFNKTKLQFQKQMEQKNREFQQKIKNQNSKLARQKKYMKDVQMSGQGDRKIKTQLQELKKVLEKQREQKKKIQNKYKVQNENLRKKLAQQASNNKLLCEKVKLLEHGSAMNKQQLNQMIKQTKKNQVMAHRVGMWAQAPNSTNLIRLMQQDFSLIEMDIGFYKYQQNQYYQYYLKIKDVHTPLQSETQDQDRAKRVYKNGKIQIQHFQRYLKQTFPFRYSIVFMYNGDIKQVLPEGIIIYYSQNSGAIHYSMKKQGLDKQIVYFPSCETVQMEVKFKDAQKNYNEVFCNGHLKRTYNNGSIIYQKKDNKGKIITMPANN